MRRLLGLCVAIGAVWGLVACQREPQANPAMVTAVGPTASASVGACQFAPGIAEMRTQVGVAIVGGCTAEGDRLMVEALRDGGHVIYFRHGATDQSQTDSDPTNLANCTTQRNLTDAGRTQAQTIGEAFRNLGIPVGTVLSSEYSRALDWPILAQAQAAR